MRALFPGANQPGLPSWAPLRPTRTRPGRPRRRDLAYPGHFPHRLRPGRRGRLVAPHAPPRIPRRRPAQGQLVPRGPPQTVGPTPRPLARGGEGLSLGTGRLPAERGGRVILVAEALPQETKVPGERGLKLRHVWIIHAHPWAKSGGGHTSGGNSPRALKYSRRKTRSGSSLARWVRAFILQSRRGEANGIGTSSTVRTTISLQASA